MTVQQIAGRVTVRPEAPGPGPPPAAPQGPAFAALLERARAAEAPRLTLSAHAAQRLDERGIGLPEPLQARISEALDTLDAKGARDAVLLGPDAAFVVNVPSRTVVTALAPDEMHDRAITQIDSAMLL